VKTTTQYRLHSR